MQLSFPSALFVFLRLPHTRKSGGISLSLSSSLFLCWEQCGEIQAPRAAERGTERERGGGSGVPPRSRTHALGPRVSSSAAVDVRAQSSATPSARAIPISGAVLARPPRKQSAATRALLAPFRDSPPPECSLWFPLPPRVTSTDRLCEFSRCASTPEGARCPRDDPALIDERARSRRETMPHGQQRRGPGADRASRRWYRCPGRAGSREPAAAAAPAARSRDVRARDAQTAPSRSER